VAPTTRPGPAPPRRIIAHAARLGGPPATEPGESPAGPPPEPARPRAPRRWAALGAGGALLVAAGGLLPWVASRAPEPPARSVRLTSPAPPAPAPSGQVTTRIVTVEPLPAQRAVVVYGQIVNDTVDTLPPMRLRVELRANGARQRLRTVWCCDALTPEQAATATRDARHPHYAHAREPGTLIRAEPGVIQDFTVVFPSVPPALAGQTLEATVERVVAAGG
jgi:hypothetical protein